MLLHQLPSASREGQGLATRESTLRAQMQGAPPCRRCRQSHSPQQGALLCTNPQATACLLKATTLLPASQAAKPGLLQRQGGTRGGGGGGGTRAEHAGHPEPPKQAARGLMQRDLGDRRSCVARCTCCVGVLGRARGHRHCRKHCTLTAGDRASCLVVPGSPQLAPQPTARPIKLAELQTPRGPEFAASALFRVHRFARRGVSPWLRLLDAPT